jgi:hypothetical protein
LHFHLHRKKLQAEETDLCLQLALRRPTATRGVFVLYLRDVCCNFIILLSIDYKQRDLSLRYRIYGYLCSYGSEYCSYMIFELIHTFLLRKELRTPACFRPVFVAISLLLAIFVSKINCSDPRFPAEHARRASNQRRPTIYAHDPTIQ